MDGNGSELMDGEDKCSALGLILPLTDESGWNHGFRAFIYLLGLLWSFMGVAIIADIFMCAIEVITSMTKKLKIVNNAGEVEEVEIRVWNDTVANLTLMALGSSAPEILLSVIEIAGNGFQSGPLGPSTIVGSAAFNLLIITAVCIMGIPEGETRRIKRIKVFAVTTSFSLFAYIWLYIALQVSSPNEVELWEAVLTFICFPLLVVGAYIIDKEFCGKKEHEQDMELGLDKNDAELAPGASYLTAGHIDKEAVGEFMKEIGKHPDLDETTIAKLLALESQQHEHHSRGWYRINASRSMAGRQKVSPYVDPHVMELYRKIKAKEVTTYNPTSDLSNGGTRSVVEFSAASVAVFENEKKVNIVVKRYGLLSTQHMVKFETFDGTAEAGQDYIPKKGQLIFEPGETTKNVEIEIIDDYEWEPDETFFVKLNVDTKGSAIVGKHSIIEVTIINDDEPGTLEFTKTSFIVKESIGSAVLPVIRNTGSDGRIEVSWKTKDIEAVNGTDYTGGEGTLTFEHGEREKFIEIPIIDDQEYEKDESFEVELFEPTAGSQLGRLKKTVVTIINDDDYTSMLDRVVKITHVNLDRLRIGNASYADQFRDAMNVNGGDVESATLFDYVMHFMTFGFKVIFACVPPPHFLNSRGYITFVVALCFIAVLTAIIGDLATIFGCLIGLLAPVTAITFVALGTSLPDTFASKTAAVNEATADNSIGNVTGSNSVNVFLGLGLPWLIAAIYWGAKDDTFAVPAGGLAFSVATYTICAIMCVILLMIRRYVGFFGKSELGGPKIGRYISAAFLITLWMLYIILSSLYEYTIIQL
eukprot:XP_011672778.1 PREDICTED: sodium/calcium exchanger 3 isoform X3 [Strongylocentrotus purpuratus]